MNAMASSVVTLAHHSDARILHYLRAEQLRLLYAQAPLSIVGGLFAAPLLTLMLWQAIPQPPLLIWLIIVETTIAARFALVMTFQRRRIGDEAVERWIEYYTWACAANGLCWGSCVFLLALAPALVHQIFIAFMLGGVLMGSVFSMTPVLSTCLLYALPLALPPVLWLLLQDDLSHVTMGVISTLHLLLTLGTTYRHHQTLIHTLRQAIENIHRVQSQAKTQQQTEQINHYLAEQQVTLQDSLDALREFYRIISTPRSLASDPIQALLKMGCQRFNTSFGVLACVEEDRYEIVQTISPDNALVSGERFSLAETWCRDTVRTHQPVQCQQASAWSEPRHPLHLQFPIETYLGAAVRVDGQIFGTLNFFDPQCRPTPFVSVDLELIQLMAQWMGTLIEQDRMAQAVQRQHTLLAHASRLNTLGEMASGLAHEINQPITAIALFAETCLARLRSGQASLHETREILEKISAQSARTNTIIQQVRYFARQSKPQYLTVRIQDMFDDIADFLQLEVRRHHMQLQRHFDADLPPVLADPLQFQQVLLNLIRNAVDAMSAIEGPRIISVFARRDEDTVEIGVKDTGPGVATDLFNQLLNPFFTTKPDGLGLGLSISQSIVEAHGGRLWATPNQGPGITFHFTLPISSRAKAAERTLPDLSLVNAPGIRNGRT